MNPLFRLRWQAVLRGPAAHLAPVVLNEELALRLLEIHAELLHLLRVPELQRLVHVPRPVTQSGLLKAGERVRR